MKKVLTIAGSDSGGGAGIQADLKTMSAHRVYGLSVITAVTAQNTKEVSGIENISPGMIRKQIDAVFDDIVIDAVKIGMVSISDTIKTIAERLQFWEARNIVIDPVMVSTSGSELLSLEAKESLIKYLIPLADVLTPNIFEAEILSGKKITGKDSMISAAKIIANLGAKSVLIKGGHLENQALDILWLNDKTYEFKSEKIITKNTHGTGCTLSSAIASNLAMGNNKISAVSKAKKFIQNAIKNNFKVGKGFGPVNHFWKMWT